MAKDRCCAMGWPDHKVMLGFCSTSVFCLLVLVVLHLSSDRSIIPCGDCKMFGSSSLSKIVELTKQEHIRQVVANLSCSLQGEQNCSTSGNKQVEVVKVVLDPEWKLPAVTKDRPDEKLDDVGTYGEPRRFVPMGSGAFLFIQFGAYRGGSNTFAVVGLGTKGLHKFGNPGFECSWVPNGDNSTTLTGNATKYYPDWGFGKQYTVIVVNCTFESDVGIDGKGGRLEFKADHGPSDHTGLPDVHFVALREDPKEFDGSIFGPPYKYDYLYCGSPLFGAISPQRIREWIAYHVHLFGPRSHFILYDAGGIHDEVRTILQPWIKLGFISLVNVRQESRYDVYYFSQFLINNDCMFKAKTLANWTFFFDVDEYLHVPKYLSFDQVMLGYHKMGRRTQQVIFKQNFMDHDHCRNESLSSEDFQRRWGFEKLVYKRTQYTKKFGYSNRKYLIQAQYALTVGVHSSQHTLLPENERFHKTVIYEDHKLNYYHYHNTINNREELCRVFVDPALNVTEIEGGTHAVDNSMAMLGDAVREFENRTIGQQPFLL